MYFLLKKYYFNSRRKVINTHWFRTVSEFFMTSLIAKFYAATINL